MTFDVFQEEYLCTTVVAEELPCLWGKPPKRVFLDVSEDVLMSFCVAGVALCDIRRVSGGMCVHDRWRLKLLCLWEKPQKTCLSRRVRRCAHAWHFVTFDVFQEECVCTTVVRVKLLCLWGKPPKRVFLNVSKDVLMSFWVAGVALCDIRCVSGGMCVRDLRGRKVAVSMGKVEVANSETKLPNVCYQKD